MTNLNAMTVDVEEYFQVEAFANDISPDKWRSCESRLRIQMESLFEVFEKQHVKATFFTLGWVAKELPGVIQDIVSNGHELASHGFMHQHLSKQDSNSFFDDISSAKKLLEDTSGSEIKGYRAPCFSIDKNNEWAHDRILEAGYEYSSSCYPIKHDLYGVPKAPLTPFYLENGLLEIPVTTLPMFDSNLPAGGGGYFRLLPFALFNWAFKRASQCDGGNFYTHPWEFDPEQPRIPSNFKSNFRHHINQSKALSKLTRLCKLYDWVSMQELYLGKRYPKYGKWTDVANGVY